MTPKKTTPSTARVTTPMRMPRNHSIPRHYQKRRPESSSSKIDSDTWWLEQDWFEIKRTNFIRFPDEIAAFRFQEKWRKIGPNGAKSPEKWQQEKSYPGIFGTQASKIGVKWEIG